MTASSAGDAPATWGQRAFRDALDRFDRHTWHTRVTVGRPVPGGLDLAGVTAEVERIVTAHEALRTVPVDSPCGLRQRISPPGPVSLHEAAVASPGSADAAALDLGEHLRHRSDGPVSAGVVTVGGVPHRLVWALSHLSVDATSAGLILDRHDGAAPPRQPREQAELESGDAYRRRSARAAAFWRTRFGGLDVPLARRERAPGGSRQAFLDSDVAAAALDDLSRRLVLPSSAVVLAAVAAGLGAVHGRRLLPMQVVTSNRHLPGLDRYVGVLAQTAPLVVDLDPELSFGALAAQVHGRAGAAYRHAFWSPDDVDAALREDGRSAAEILAGVCTVNDVRGAGHDPGPRPGSTTPQVRPLAFWPYQGGRLAVAIADAGRALRIAVRVDSAYLDEALLPELLRTVEAVLCRARPDLPVRQLTGDAVAHTAQ